MDKRKILQNIIDNDGKCDWVFKWKDNDICAACPMSKLKMRPDGSGYFSCWDSLIYGRPEKHMSPELEGKIYKEKATELLVDIVMEDMILDE